MKAALLGAFVILLVGIGTAPTARALPAAPLAEAAATNHAALLPIRHHRHHGRGRHWSSRYPPYSQPEAEAASPTTAPEATPAPPYRGSNRRAAQPVVPPAQAQSSRDTTTRAARGSGSSRPAIRWVDPDRPAR